MDLLQGQAAPFPLDRKQRRLAWLRQALGRAGRPRSQGASLLTGCIASTSPVCHDIKIPLLAEFCKR